MLDIKVPNLLMAIAVFGLFVALAYLVEMPVLSAMALVSDRNLDEWVQEFVLIFGVGSSVLAVFLYLLWSMMASGGFKFSRDTDALKKYRQIWWAMPLLIATFLPLLIFLVLAFFASFGLPSFGPGFLVAILFLLINSSLPYVLMTALGSPNGVKYMPWLSISFRKIMG